MEKINKVMSVSLRVGFEHSVGCGGDVATDGLVLSHLSTMLSDLRNKKGIRVCSISDIRFQDIPEESPAPAPVPVPPPEPKPAEKPLAPRLRAHGWTQQRHGQAVNALKQFAGADTGPKISKKLGIRKSALVHLLRGDRVGKKVIDDIIAALMEKSAPDDLIHKFRIML